MKKILVLLFLPVTTLAQQGFYIGTLANTGFYQMYNHVDFNSNFTGLQTIKPDLTKLYNFNMGLKFGYLFNEKKGINIDLTYNRYRQDYRQELLGISPTDTLTQWIYYFSEIKYSTFTASYVLNLIKKKNGLSYPLIFISAGIHFSYLIHYYEHLNENSNDIGFDDISTSTNNNGAGYSSSFEHGVQTFSKYYTTKNIYRKFVYGVNACIGIKNNLSKKIDYSIEITGLYDINNVDNLNATISYDRITRPYWNGNAKFGYGKGQLSERPATHNIYAGFGFSLFYYLGGDYYYK